jgi:hypothetical protein
LGAYVIISGYVTFFLTAVGVWGWLTEAPAYASSSEQRLYTATPSAQLLAACTLAYQLWNLGMCVLIPDYRTPALIGHHATTAALSWVALFPYCHYYVLFFGGIGEASTIPLTLLDVLKHFPELRALVPGAYELSQYWFAISFIAIRCFWWPFVCGGFWRDSLAVISSTAMTQGEFIIVSGVFASSVAMMGLQFFWGYKLVAKMRRVLASSERTACAMSQAVPCRKVLWQAPYRSPMGRLLSMRERVGNTEGL